MKKTKKIILDTNIWISYIIGQKLDEIAQLIFHHDLIIFSCSDLEEELEDVLRRSKFKELLRYDAEVYLNFVDRLTTSIHINKTFNGCPDEKDNYLFDLAFQSGSAYLVTGDKMLLNMEVKNIKIISFKLFKDKFELQSD